MTRRAYLITVPVLAATLLIQCRVARAESAPPDGRGGGGVVRYEPPADEARTPTRFRLPRHEFAYDEQALDDISERLTISLVTFPSPVTTPHERNNTVHCEYYRPHCAGRVPAVVVLHILGGDFELARLFCNALAHRNVAALFVKMPYYGPGANRESGDG